MIWGQSLKGALRDAARDQVWEVEVFGDRPPTPAPADDSVTEVAPGDAGGELRKGGVSFGDAQLLAFPAATLRNTFAWTTSKLLMHRLARKVALLDKNLELADLLDRIGGVTGTAGGAGWPDTTVIGPYVDTVTTNTDVVAIGALLAALACPTGPVFDYTRGKLTDDLLVLPDEALSELTKLGTDVVARVQLKSKEKTVQHGPFYSEHLPVETVLVAVLTGEEHELAKLTTFFDNTAIQLGGEETIGKGVLWCRVHDTDSVTGALTSARSRLMPTAARS